MKYFLYIIILVIGFILGQELSKGNNKNLSFFKCYKLDDVVYKPELYGKTDGEKSFGRVLVNFTISNPNADKLREIKCE